MNVLGTIPYEIMIINSVILNPVNWTYSVLLENSFKTSAKLFSGKIL